MYTLRENTSMGVVPEAHMADNLFTLHTLVSSVRNICECDMKKIRRPENVNAIMYRGLPARDLHKLYVGPSILNLFKFGDSFRVFAMLIAPCLKTCHCEANKPDRSKGPYWQR